LSYIPTPNSPTRLSTTHVWKRLSSSARFVVPSLSLPLSGQAGVDNVVHDFVIADRA